MTLNSFLATLPRGGQRHFAARIKVVPPYLTQLSIGFRVAGIETAARIERETGGAVSAEELRPDVDWALIRASGPASNGSAEAEAAA